MRFGLDVPTTGEYADPRVQAQLAAEAEAAGWDGFFLWDVLLGGADMTTDVLDPWIALTRPGPESSCLQAGEEWPIAHCRLLARGRDERAVGPLARSLCLTLHPPVGPGWPIRRQRRGAPQASPDHLPHSCGGVSLL